MDIVALLSAQNKTERWRLFKTATRWKQRRLLPRTKTETQFGVNAPKNISNKSRAEACASTRKELQYFINFINEIEELIKENNYSVVLNTFKKWLH